MTGSDMPDLMPNNKAKRLGVTALTADLKKVRVDGNKPAEAVPGCEGVQHTITAHHIRIGNTAQTRRIGGLGDHGISLRKLRRRNTNAAHALLCVEEGTSDQDNQGCQNQ